MSDRGVRTRVRNRLWPVMVRLAPVDTASRGVLLLGALVVGLLVVGAVLVPVVAVQAVLAGIAAAGGVALVATLLLSVTNTSLTEARQLWGLTGLMLERRPWPAPGGWALGPEAIALVHDAVTRRGLRTVVELGPGVSSVILGRALPDIEFYGVEHDPFYAQRLADQLRDHAVTNYQVLSAPLVGQQVEGRSVEWYEPVVLEQLPDSIDVLIVDGPPNWDGRSRRAAALPMLGPRLRPGALVVVDDAARPDERKMVTAWLATGRVRLLEDRVGFVVLEMT